MIFMHFDNDDNQKPCRAKSPESCPYSGNLHGTPEQLEHILLLTQDPVSTISASEENISIEARRGANVDKNERYVTSFLTGKINAAQAARIIHQLPNERKTLPFRGKSEEVVLSVIEDLNKTLRSSTSEDEIFVSNPNNRVGQDLIATKSGESIELKIGYGITNGALGLSTAALFLPGQVSENFLTAKERNENISLYENGSKKEVETRWKEHIGKLNDSTPIGTISNSNHCKVLNALVSGTSKAEDLKKYLDGEPLPVYTTIKAVPDKSKESGTSWEAVKTRPLEKELSWMISLPDNEDESNKRYTVLFTREDGVQVKLVYNQKNTAKIKDKDTGAVVEKVGYGYGLGTMSFNMWVTDKR